MDFNVLSTAWGHLRTAEARDRQADRLGEDRYIEGDREAES